MNSLNNRFDRERWCRVIGATFLFGLAALCAPAIGVDSPDAVYAVVCGEKITPEKARAAVNLKAKFAELEGNKREGRRFAMWANRHANAIIAEMIQRKLVAKGLEAKEVKVTDEAKKTILGYYNRRFKLCAENIEEIAEKMGEYKEEFLTLVAIDERIEAFNRAVTENAITPEKIERVKKMRKFQCDWAAKMNAEAKEKAENAYARLKAGEDWLKVAEEMAEDETIDEESGKEYAKNWGEYRLTDLPEEIAGEISGLKVGEFSSPVEAEDGIVILKVVEKDGLLYKLARIGFCITIEPPEESDGQIKRRLEFELIRKHQSELIKPFEKEVEYPQGKNFSVRLWDTTK